MSLASVVSLSLARTWLSESMGAAPSMASFAPSVMAYPFQISFILLNSSIVSAALLFRIVSIFCFLS